MRARAEPLPLGIRMKARLVSLPLVRPPARWLLRLRDKVRASEIMFAAVAIAVGSGAGLLTLLQDAMTRGLQQLLCGFPSHLRLSELTAIPAWRLLALSLGGLALDWLHAAGAGPQAQADRRDGGERAAPRTDGRGRQSRDLGTDDPVERVRRVGRARGGLCAARQHGRLVRRRWLELHRADPRILAGAGAGASIAAAFGTRLAGASTPSAVAPAVAASLAGTQVA